MIVQNTCLSIDRVLLFCFKKKEGVSRELHLTDAPNEGFMNKKRVNVGSVFGMYLMHYLMHSLF